jgi:putative addiction module component (TIGR02574 family)
MTGYPSGVAQTDKIPGLLKHQAAISDQPTHRAELDRRWSAYLANPGIALSRERFRAQIAAAKKRTTR